MVYYNSSEEPFTISCWNETLEISCQKMEKVLKKATAVGKLPTYDLHRKEGHTNTFDCPTWMHYSNETDQCVCGVSHHGIVKCNATLNETFILDCHRMTYDEDKQQVIAGLSFYGCLNQAQLNDIYHPVPTNRSQINDVMCGNQFNRDGRLCGACMDGYSPLVYSYQLYCKKCSDEESKYNWAKFIAMAFVPLTGFYSFVVLFKFNANSPSLQAFVFFAQMIANPANIRILSTGWKFGKLLTFLTKLLSTLYGIWNLDYFRNIYPDVCLRLTTLQALSLDYVVALYPLLLIALTCIAFKLHEMEVRIIVWIWKPIRWCIIKIKHTDNIKTSMIDVFATFLLLSYGKVLSVNFDLLAYTVPIDSSGRPVGRYLYYDASYKYFGREHLPYGLIAIISFTVFNVLPSMVLLLYPIKWFQKCLNHLRLSHLALHTFVDSFAGCYKDGTEPGTRDCRYFAAFFLLIRICSYIVYQLTLSVSFYGWTALIMAAFSILIVIVQPYKSKYNKYNFVTIVIISVICMVATCLMNVNVAFVKDHQAVSITAIVAAILIALPQLYFFGICIVTMYKYQTFIKCPSKTPRGQRSLSESSLLLASEHQKNYKMLV